MNARWAVCALAPLLLICCTPPHYNNVTGLPARHLSEELARGVGQPTYGEFVVSTHMTEGWRETIRIPAGKHPQEFAVDIPAPAGDEPAIVRITVDGGGAAHLDVLLLDGEGPSAVSGVGNGVAKLSRSDLDIVAVDGVAVICSPQRTCY